MLKLTYLPAFMLQEFKPPSWAKQVIAEGDAAYGAKANIKLVKQLDTYENSPVKR